MITHDVLTVIFSFIETYDEYKEYYKKFQSALSHTTYKNVVIIDKVQNINHYDLRIASNMYNHGINYEVLELHDLSFNICNEENVGRAKRVILHKFSFAPYDRYIKIIQHILSECDEIHCHIDSFKYAMTQRDKITKVIVERLFSTEQKLMSLCPNLHECEVRYHGGTFDCNVLYETKTIRTLIVLSYENCDYPMFHRLLKIDTIPHIKTFIFKSNVGCYVYMHDDIFKRPGCELRSDFKFIRQYTT